MLKYQNFIIAIIFTIIGSYFLYFNERYTFAYNSALTSCLNAKLLLVDKWDLNVRKGDYAAFYMSHENPFYPVNRKWIKKIAATEGQTVHVTDSSVTVGSTVDLLSMDYILAKLKQDASIYTFSKVIPKNELFMIGETVTSYDSRFWGTVKQDEIIGKAYVVF